MEPNTFTHHILRIGWAGKRPSPQIELRDLATGQETVLNLFANYDFNWQLSRARYCPGWHDLATGEHHPCPAQNMLTGLADTCRLCEKLTGFKDAYFYGKKPSAAVSKFMAQPHYLYLAFFPPHIIKVGTAAESRQHLRLIEQDALIAMYIAKHDGFNIHKLERAVSKQLHFPEAVRGKFKRQFISFAPDLEYAQKQLSSAYQEIHDHFRNTEFNEWIYPPSQLKLANETTNPFIYFPSTDVELSEPKNLIELNGKYLGLRGRFMLVKTEDAVLLIDKRQLEGKYLQAH